MKTKITDDALRALTGERERSGKPQIIRFDTDTDGLAVVVGASTTTFIVHHRVGADVKRETLGRWKGRGGEMSVTDARKAARKIVGKLEGKEATPGTMKRASKLGPTLADACGIYVAEMVRTECRPTSIASVKREIGDKERSYLKAWLDRPLGSITGKECRTRHEQIAAGNGPHVANRVMRELRAIWNHVAKEASGGTVDGLPDGHVFPANPTIAVQWIEKSRKTKFVKRVGKPIADEDLPAWHAAVVGLKSEVGSGKFGGKKRDEHGARRDYNLIVILTGLRRSDAASLRWEHINLTDEPAPSRVWNGEWEAVTLPPHSILRPSPKGGANRAFALPLSSHALKILSDRRDQKLPDNGWVFPTVAIVSDADRVKSGKERCYICQDLGMPEHVKGATIHITEPKEDDSVLVSPHRLRDTYCTVLGKLDPAVPAKITKLLMNHSLDESDVTEGYMSIDIEALRAPQQRVADYLASAWAPKNKLKSVKRDASAA